MSTEREGIESKKAMAYDILHVLTEADERDGQEHQYSLKEIRKIIDAYIAGLK